MPASPVPAGPRSPAPRSLSLSQARRIAIAAQGLDRARPAAVTMRHVTSTVERIGLLQIDSVNVVARAHLLPLFSRLGPYDTALVDRASARAPRRLLETWAHEASYVPAATYPLLAHRRRAWNRMDRPSFDDQHPGLLEAVLGVVAQRGPLSSREIEAHLDARHAQRPDGGWGWSWSAAKTATEILFDDGALAVARRNAQFERVLDLPERVLPPVSVTDAPLDPADANRELIRIAACAHGIGTVRCLADYFRLGQAATRTAISELVEEGALVPVTVRGWDRPLWLDAGARIPRRSAARALLAPFDPLVFERRRLVELFGMHYRIGIYTPAAQRTHGYYALPFLLGDHLVARVDLKHDRGAGTLVVRGAFAEVPGPDEARWPTQGEVVAELAAELGEAARWLGAERVVVDDGAPGELSADLTAELAGAGGQG